MTFRWSAVLMVGLLLPQTALAEMSASSNFRNYESLIGGSGLVEESSANFKAGESIGDIGVGDSYSTNFGSSSGYTTTEAPTLTLSVDDSPPNFGTFATGAATTAVSHFTAANYTSYGYLIQILGNPPTNGSKSLNAMTTAGPSSVGTEQFGINLVANTFPAVFGTNPDNVVAGLGQALGGYSTPNNFKFSSGDSIAYAPKSSGMTNYTISYLVNASSRTPGGVYTTNLTLLCIGYY